METPEPARRGGPGWGALTPAGDPTSSTWQL